jgi:hypothetical protein
MIDSPTLDAERIKQEAIEASKQALIESLQGGKKNKFSWEDRGKQAPDTYEELFSEVEKRVSPISQEDIDRRVEEKLAEKEKEREELSKQTQKQQEDAVTEKRKAFDNEWYDLVNQGKMPKPDPKVMERINKGEHLTMDEINADEGLRARLELAKVAVNKSAKIAYYEDYGKDPAGATAPVLGTRPSASQKESQELDYDRDVAPMRKRIFGF